ncbi:MAG: glycosyltransferase, partial [Anaerolineales bacterium]
AEALRVPLIIAPLQPLTRTRNYPSAILPSTFSIGSMYNAVTHRFAELALWLPWRGVINTWRAATLGLRSLPVSGPFPELYASGVPFVYGISPHVVPRPSDWPAHHTLAGYWPAPPSDWQPTEELTRFVENGAPPVYVGFGSMGAGKVRAIAEALAHSGLRVIVPAPQSGERETLRVATNVARSPAQAPLAPASSGVAPSPSVCAVSDMPHDWLFPRLAAVIHHGGAGTTATALRAGVPQLIVPFAVDQFFWGQRVFELGVGSHPMPHASLNVPRVVEVVRNTIDDTAMRQRVRELAEQVTQEDGVGMAAQLIGAYLQR